MGLCLRWQPAAFFCYFPVYYVSCLANKLTLSSLMMIKRWPIFKILSLVHCPENFQ